MSNKKKLNLYIVVSAFVLILLYSILLLRADIVIKVASEDGIVEYLGALSFLLAAIIFGWLYIKSNQSNNLWIFKTKKNIFFILLSLLFVFAAGEEVSWGQRLIGFETPSYIESSNQQGEFNLHNLPIFHANNAQGEKKSGLARLLTAERLFAFFWLSYCLVIPLMANTFGWAKTLVKTVSLPLVPIQIGMLFLLSHLIYKAIEMVLVMKDSPLLWQMTEIKETSMAFLILTMSVYFMTTQAAQGARFKRIFGKPLAT